jgi:hypothetical protein
MTEISGPAPTTAIADQPQVMPNKKAAHLAPPFKVKLRNKI